MNTPENINVISKSIKEADKFLSSIKVDKRNVDLTYFNDIKNPFINKENSKIDLSLIEEEDKIKLRIRVYRKQIDIKSYGNIIIINKKYDKSHLLKFNTNVIWVEKNMSKYINNTYYTYNDNRFINMLVNDYLDNNNDQDILREFIKSYSYILENK